MGTERLLPQMKKRAKQLKLELYTLYFAYRDVRVPWYAKLVAVSVVAYAFSPVDLIPDFIPILGYLDDLILVPLGIVFALKLIPQQVLAECREKAQEMIGKRKPKNWLVAAFIVLIWLLCIGWFIWLFWK